MGKRVLLCSGIFTLEVAVPPLPTPLQELEKNIRALLERNAQLERQVRESGSGEGGAALQKLQADYNALSERYQKLAAQNSQQRQLQHEAVEELKSVRRELLELRKLLGEGEHD